MNTRIVLLTVLTLVILFAFIASSKLPKNDTKELGTKTQQVNDGGPEENIHPLSIAALRSAEHPGSDIVIEQTLEPGSNYSRAITSYKSDGLKIYALLTVPNGTPPAGGWPVVIFNHGFIPPAQYRTTERYIAYTDAFSRNGYIVFRSDYRGHGSSEGTGSSYGSNGYTIDVLNAVASMKKYPAANPDKIGMWGHSMGGHITLRSMVVNKDIKAGVIWAGVVASYPDLLNNWRRRQMTSPAPSPLPGNTNTSRNWRQTLVTQYGEPKDNPEFWNSISANSYLSDISGPLQLHHGTADHSVPHAFSETLAEQMKKAKKEVELYIYPGDEHDIPVNFGIAMERSVAFFDKYLKNN